MKIRSKQSKIKFPELEREEKRDKLATVGILVSCLTLTAVTLLALLEVLPIWVFPIPFASITLAAIVVRFRSKKDKGGV